MGSKPLTHWLNETLYSGWGQRFEVEAVLAEERSQFQHIVVAQTRSHGRVLVLDVNIQVTEADEFVYQEMLAHVPLLAHGTARRVLIVGAGDGGVLRRVLQHDTVESVTLVEIDGAVIRLAQTYLPSLGGDSWYDRRATIIVGDGIQHIARADQSSYDVIIVDSTDPVSIGEALFTEEFYAGCAHALGEGCVIVNQSGVPFMQAAELRASSSRRAKSFPYVTAYVAAVPTYVGGFMAMGFAAKTAGLDRVATATLKSRAAEAGVLGTTRYWSPEVHAAAFQLPPYISRHLPG